MRKVLLKKGWMDTFEIWKQHFDFAICFQRVHLTLSDNGIHIFDRGIMSVQGVIDAIQK